MKIRCKYIIYYVCRHFLYNIEFSEYRECAVFIDNTLVAKALDVTKKKAYEEAISRAYHELKGHCYTIKVIYIFIFSHKIISFTFNVPINFR